MSNLYDSQESRARSNAWCWGAIVLGFLLAGAYGYHEYYGPFCDFVDQIELRREKAAIYLTADICTKSEMRASLENYNECEASRRLLRQNVNRLAFHALMDQLRWCHNGVCTIWGINITENFYSIARLCNYALILAFFGATYMFFTSILRKQSAWGQLPTTNASTAQQSAFMAGMMAATQFGNAPNLLHQTPAKPHPSTQYYEYPHAKQA